MKPEWLPPSLGEDLKWYEWIDWRRVLLTTLFVIWFVGMTALIVIAFVLLITHI